MSEDVTILVSALISKMERMDAQIRDLNTQMHSADILLKRAGFVRATTPAAEDVWGTLCAVRPIQLLLRQQKDSMEQ